MKVNGVDARARSVRHGLCRGRQEFYSPVAQWQSERLFTVRSVVRIHPGEPNSGSNEARMSADIVTARRGLAGRPLTARTASSHNEARRGVFQRPRGFNT